MTKQEEIKKMAITMCGFYNKGKCAFPEYESCDKFNSQECSYKEDAEELYYAGYRKADDVRKETAKDFAEKVKMAFYYEFDEIIPSIMADKIDELLKEYGVEE